MTAPLPDRLAQAYFEACGWGWAEVDPDDKAACAREFVALLPLIEAEKAKALREAADDAETALLDEMVPETVKQADFIRWLRRHADRIKEDK